MKDLKTTTAGILAAAIILATSKKWIDLDLAGFLSATVAIIFGVAAKDAKKE